MMKIGIEEGAYIGRYGLIEGLKKMKAQGYECLDYQKLCPTGENTIFAKNDKEFEKQLIEERDIINSYGIEISQTHGPWRYPPQDATPEDRAERFEKMSRAIWGNSILKCRYFVIHPIMPFGPGNDPDPKALWDMNLDFMSKLTEVAKQHDVVICYENMPMGALSNSKPEAILRFAKEINSPWFKVCLDTGHVSVFGDSPAEAVRLIGKEYLKVLHVHDNNGRQDLHWIPYTGVINWDDFSNALEEIGFDGAMSLETSVPRGIPADLRPLQEESLFQMAKKIARR